MITNEVNWVGREIAGGRYRIEERLDKGSMGHVYRALDRRLETEVVLKMPVAADESLEGPEFLERFNREIQSLVRLSHPHIVRIIDVGSEEGLPYVVMQYLTGGSLKARMGTDPKGNPQPMPAQSLLRWLPAVAEALDFVHAQHYIHRDVKPANILFDQHGNAFLGDFGLIKALAKESKEVNASSLTGVGLLVGTPNYLAPEIVMGKPAGPRVDQYSLAMTVFEVLTGNVFVEGPTATATIVNQTTIDPPPLVDLLPGIPRSLSDAVLRGLAKDPRIRFESCTEFAQAVLEDVPRPSTRSGTMSPLGKFSRGEPGRAPCPSCQAILPVSAIHANKRVRCQRCRAVSLVQFPEEGGALLTLVHPPAAPSARAGTGSGSTPSLTGIPRPGLEGNPQAHPQTALSPMGTPPSGLDRSEERPVSPAPDSRIGTGQVASKLRRLPRRTVQVGLAAVALLVLVGVGLWITSGGGTNASVSPRSDSKPRSSNPILAPAEEDVVELNIAYGTEKEKWLKAALAEYEKTPAGRRVKINLVGLGSVEGAKAVLNGPEAVIDGKKVPPIHVWSPASSAYRGVFENEWELRNKYKPILREANLALTPMVFVMWKERYDAFVKRYPKLSFRTVSQAMQEKAGWRTIADRPEWGLFNFAHTDPNKSNSGLLALVLMAYEFADKERGLTVADITDSKFQEWLRAFERGVARPPGGTLTHSTGTLMKEMVLRGPSQYDCLVLYENLAIENLTVAKEHWGELYVSYPEPNMWNEHPYYVLDVEWSHDAHRRAAEQFLDFLLTEKIQRKALDYGFRPGISSVPVRFPDSPLVKNGKFGVKIDVPRLASPPSADVATNLLNLFKRLEP